MPTASSRRHASSDSDSIPSETTTAPTSAAKATIAAASDWRTGSSSMPHTSERSSLRISGFTRVTWRKEEKPEPTSSIATRMSCVRSSSSARPSAK